MVRNRLTEEHPNSSLFPALSARASLKPVDDNGPAPTGSLPGGSRRASLKRDAVGGQRRGGCSLRSAVLAGCGPVNLRHWRVPLWLDSERLLKDDTHYCWRVDTKNGGGSTFGDPAAAAPRPSRRASSSSWGHCLPRIFGRLPEHPYPPTVTGDARASGTDRRPPHAACPLLGAAVPAPSFGAADGQRDPPTP